MPAVCVWKCFCGIQWKTIDAAEGPRQTHLCSCKRTHEVTGVVTSIFHSTCPNLPIDEQWIEVPNSRLQEWLLKP